MRRRTALSLGATMATTGTIGLAGCLGVLEDDDSTSDGYAFGDLAPRLPAAETFDPGSIFVTGAAPNSFPADDSAQETVTSVIGDAFTNRPLDTPAPEDTDFVLAARYWPAAAASRRNGYLATFDGEFDVETTIDSLEASGFEHRNATDGYELYVDGENAWAVGGETIVAARWPSGSVEGLRRTIGATSGDVARLVDEHGPLDRIATAQPAGEWLFVEQASATSNHVMPANEDESVRAVGESFAVESEETTITTAIVFSSTDVASEAFLREYVDDADGGDPDSATYELDGVLGKITASRPTSELI